MSILEVETKLVYATSKVREQALIIADLVKRHEAQQQSIASLKTQIIDLEQQIAARELFKPTYA